MSFTANTGGASISEFQPLGLISALRLSLIGGVSDDTKVSRSDDKTSERQPRGRRFNGANRFQTGRPGGRRGLPSAAPVENGLGAPDGMTAQSIDGIAP